MSEQLNGCLIVGQCQPTRHTRLSVTAKYNPPVRHYKYSPTLSNIYLYGKFKCHLSLQIILKSKTVPECNSSLLASFEQNSSKSQNSVPDFFHSSLAPACTKHHVNIMILFQFHLLNFQRQQLLSTVHQARPTRCMKVHSHHQCNPQATWVINSRWVVTGEELLTLTFCSSPSAAIASREFRATTTASKRLRNAWAWGFIAKVCGMDCRCCSSSVIHLS